MFWARSTIEALPDPVVTGLFLFPGAITAQMCQVAVERVIFDPRSRKDLGHDRPAASSISLLSRLLRRRTRAAGGRASETHPMDTDDLVRGAVLSASLQPRDDGAVAAPVDATDVT